MELIKNNLVKQCDTLDLDLDNKKKYIFYQEQHEKKGIRYDEIIKNNDDMNNYSSHSPSCFKLIDLFESLDITDNDSILDIGCGKGLSLIIASAFKFKNICGVEISNEYFEICKKNLVILNLDLKINLINDDILNFEDYQNFNYYYFYNPFNCEIFNLIIEKILKKQKRFKIIYKNIHDAEINILFNNNIILSDIIKGDDRDYYIFNYNKL
jgi:SAM-dependent methyltransferase